VKGAFAIVGFSALWGVVAIAGSSGADSRSAPPSSSVADDPAGAVVKIRDERLSVWFDEAPLSSVLLELGRATQATFEVHGVMPPTVTDSFEAVPIEQGLRRLFRGANVGLLYAGSGAKADASKRLVRVWIFAKSFAKSAGTGAGRDAATEAKDALIDSTETSTRDALLAAMRDSEPDVREGAIDALGDLRDEAAVGLLSRALTQDEDEDVRESAADALGDIGSPQGVDALKISLKDESPDVRESAADALGDIGSPQGVDALKISLKDESPDVRESAVDALRRIGGPEVIPALHGALSDEDEDVREAAAESLRALEGGGPSDPSSATTP